MADVADQADVLILGGGCAGLAAARSLALAGRSVTVLEARNRLGGRVYTVHAGGFPVELGAEFVHGRPPVTMQMLQESQLPWVQLGGAVYHASDDGTLERESDAAADQDDDFSELANLPATDKDDRSFAEAIQQMQLQDWHRASLTGYVEGFNAADATKISAASLVVQQKAEAAIEGDTSQYLTRGYGSLVDWLAAECRRLGVAIHMESPVRSVLWRAARAGMQSEVVAVCDAQQLHASRCVVALPLAVLKQGSVQFQPEPQPFFAALRAVEMGDALRISLLFHDAFWQQRAPELQFLLSRQQAIPVWWTRHPQTSPMLTGWIGGPRAAAAISPEAFLAIAIQSLAELFQIAEADLRNQLVAWHTHDWHCDPYSLGAYSYVAAGGLPLLPQIAAPVQDTLYFAGEHTEQDGNWGTVHAALASGMRAAAQIMER